jgi:uncharacterized membrane protein YfcA
VSPDLLTLLSGSLVGLVLGVVGGGGSILAVPLLLYVVGMPSAHAALGTSAVAVALSAFANLIGAMARKMVKWPCALAFTAAGIVGSAAGAQLALAIPGARIIPLFGGLMLVVGTLMLLRKNAEGDANVRLSISTARNMLPAILGLGLAAGALAGFFGIGGGFLIVPALMLATGMPITYAIATSLVSITAFGATTAATYAWAGEVDWHTLAWFVAGAAIGSAAGQFVGHKVSHHRSMLQTIFASVVMAVGVYVVVKG